MNKKLLLTGIVLIIVYKLLDSAGEIILWLGKLINLISPCIIGGIIALFLYTPCKKIKGVILHTGIKKYADAVSIFCVYAVIFGGVAAIVVYFVPVIYKNSEQFINNFPLYMNEAEEYMNSNKYLKQLGQVVLSNAKGYMETEKITSFLVTLKEIAGNFASVFFGVVISIHLIAEEKNIINYCRKVVKRIAGEKVYKYIKKTKNTLFLFSAYFSGIAIDSIIVAAVISIGFTIMEVPYSLLLGILIGTGNLVPVFGPHYWPYNNLRSSGNSCFYIKRFVEKCVDSSFFGIGIFYRIKCYSTKNIK